MFQNLFLNEKKNLSVKIFYTYDTFCCRWFLFYKKKWICQNMSQQKIKLLILMSKSNTFFIKWLVIILKYYKAIKLGRSFLFVLMLLNISIQVKSDFFFHDMTYNLPFSKILFSYNNKYQHPRPSWRTFDTHHLTDTTDAFL